MTDIKLIRQRLLELGYNQTIIDKVITEKFSDHIKDISIKGHDIYRKGKNATLGPIAKYNKRLYGGIKGGAKGAAIGAGIGYVAKKVSVCGAKCDKFYVSKTALIGSLADAARGAIYRSPIMVKTIIGLSVGISSAVLLTLIGVRERKICYYKCKVDYYKSIKNEDLAKFWQKKLDNEISKYKEFIKKLKDKDKAKQKENELNKQLERKHF